MTLFYGTQHGFHQPYWCISQNELLSIGERCEEGKRQASDHAYGLPACPNAVKAKLDAAYAKVRQLEREKINALTRERRAKKTVEALLEELEAKNQVIDELQDKLDRYAGKIRQTFSPFEDICKP